MAAAQSRHGMLTTMAQKRCTSAARAEEVCIQIVQANKIPLANNSKSSGTSIGPESYAPHSLNASCVHLGLGTYRKPKQVPEAKVP